VKIPFKKTKDGITINVRVQPRSSRKGIEVMGDTLKVKLTAPPVEGEANEQLVEILSETLGIRKSSFRIIRGLSSRNKVVEVTGVKDF
jgi:uncharacterized protein (TIGR00251 family)